MALVEAGSQLPCKGKRYIAFVFGDVIAILIPGSNVARIVRLPNRLYHWAGI